MGHWQPWQRAISPARRPQLGQHGPHLLRAPHNIGSLRDRPRSARTTSQQRTVLTGQAEQVQHKLQVGLIKREGGDELDTTGACEMSEENRGCNAAVEYLVDQVHNEVCLQLLSIGTTSRHDGR